VAHTLIYGIDTLLGSWCAARLLHVPNIRISYLPASCPPEQIADLIVSASLQIEDKAAVPSVSEIRSGCSPA